MLWEVSLACIVAHLCSACNETNWASSAACLPTWIPSRYMDAWRRWFDFTLLNEKIVSYSVSHCFNVYVTLLSSLTFHPIFFLCSFNAALKRPPWNLVSSSRDLNILEIILQEWSKGKKRKLEWIDVKRRSLSRKIKFLNERSGEKVCLNILSRSLYF